MKKVISIVLALLCVVCVFASCGNSQDEQTPTNGQEIVPGESYYPMGNEIFKGIESYDLDGNKVDDTIFKGKKLTMVNIWGTFCGPCIGGMPDFQTLSEEYADKDFQVIGIVCDAYVGDAEKTELAKEICKETGAKYVSILASESLDDAILDSVISVPVTYFLNEKGEQFDRNFVGSKSLDGWKAVVDLIYAEMEQ